jgi:putative polyketide hydroxylase
MFVITYQPALGESFEEFSAERCQKLVEKAIGQPGMACRDRGYRPFPACRECGGAVPDRACVPGRGCGAYHARLQGAWTQHRYSERTEPSLAAVIRAQAGQELLATYQAERHPVGRFAAHQSLTGPAATVFQKGTKSELLPQKEDLPIFFPIVGYRYRSQAVVASDAAGSEQEIALLDRQDLTGEPGTRVPHLWLERQGRRISILDLLDGRFVLLTGTGGIAWGDAAAAIADKTGIGLAHFRIGADANLLDVENSWQAKMGVSSDGAVLLRPDGFVAWRSCTLATRPESSLLQALSQILCRPIDPSSS